jgi:hypothetical protein
MGVLKNMKIKYICCTVVCKKKRCYSEENNYLTSCVILDRFVFRLARKYFSLKLCESLSVYRNFKVQVLYKIMKECMQGLFLC